MLEMVYVCLDIVNIFFIKRKKEKKEKRIREGRREEIYTRFYIKID